MSAVTSLMEYFFPISIFVSFVAAAYQLSNSRNLISRWSGWALIGITLNLACYFLLWTRVFPAGARWLVFLQVVGYLLLDVSFLVLVIFFTGHARWINRFSMSILCLAPFAVIVAALAQWQSLPVQLADPGAGFGVPTNLIRYPAGFLEILLILYSNFVALLAVSLLIAMLINAPRRYEPATLGLLASTVVIECAGILEIIDANPFSNLSILQTVVGLSGLPIILIVFYWKGLTNLPITRQVLQNTLRDGYVIADPDKRVVEFNAAFQRLVGSQKPIDPGENLVEIFTRIGFNIDLLGEQPAVDGSPRLLQTQGSIFEVRVYPIIGARSELMGNLVVCHNVSDRDALEDALRKKNVALSRNNAFLSALARMTLSLQSSHGSQALIDTLGDELLQLGLHCFLTLYDPQRDELVVQYVSEHQGIIRMTEKILGSKLVGFPIDRARFESLYQFFNSRQAQYYLTFEDLLPNLLGSLTSWIVKPLRNVGVTRNEPSMLIPMFAGEKPVGLIGVWGKDLQESDMSPFHIFGSYLAWAIEKADFQAAERQRLQRLDQSNAMITALSKISSQIVAIPDLDVAFLSLGEELGKIDLNCVVSLMDPEKNVVTIRYVSFQAEFMRAIERLLGQPLVGFEISRSGWPGGDLIDKGEIVWYGHAEDVFKRALPDLSKKILLHAFQMLKGSQVGSLCVVPLKLQNRVIGSISIWGKHLAHEDATALSVFGDQVAAILQRNLDYEKEIQKSTELARKNSMILALSGVAAQLDSTNDLQTVLNTLGKELRKVGLYCLVGTVDPAKEYLKIEYITFGEDVRQVIQKIGFNWQDELVIPRRLWPTEKAIVERAPVWDQLPMENVHRMFPYLPNELFKSAMHMIGWDLTQPVCYVPMINNNDVIGIITVWGKELRQEDLGAFSILANQVATAIKNARSFMDAQNEIAARTQAEARIQKALTEKEVLLKEVHHRVKNNLQVVSSLLSLQAGQGVDPATREALKESQNRVRSMALIHEKLYQSDDLASIDFCAYLNSLVHSLSGTYRVKAGMLEIQVKAEQINLPLDTAISCGLMVNELISNAIKYAFPDEQKGRILVSCRLQPDGFYLLTVSDNGIGLPPGLSTENTPSLGLQLVNSLVHQIGGSLLVDREKGARFEIRFPRPPAERK